MPPSCGWYTRNGWGTIGLIWQHGYIYIPMVDLDVPYDEVNAPSEVFPTWWGRFLIGFNEGSQ